MQTQQTEAMALVGRLFAAVNAGDLGALGALAAPDCTCTGLPFAGPPALVAPFAELRAAMPGLQLVVDELRTHGDEATVRYHGAGVHEGFFGSIPPSGASVRLQGADVLRIAGGLVQHRQPYLDRLVLVQQMTDPRQATAPEQPVTGEIVTRFDPPKFLEGVLATDDGTVYVTPLHEGTVYRVWPDGRREPFFHVEAGHGPWNGAWCMVAAADGNGFYLNVNSLDPAGHGIWHVDRDGRGRVHAVLPPQTIPNGIARTAAGDLLVADSVGCVWRVRGPGQAEVWLRHEWLAARPWIGRFPGANGIQVWNDTTYVTTSDLGLIVAIPITAGGGAGTPRIFAEHIGGDDFAIDTDGTLYVTTHPFNQVVRIRQDGSRTVIAGPAQGVVGPTAAALGRDGAGRRLLYVVTDGGMFTLPECEPVPLAAQTPALVRLRLD